MLDSPRHLTSLLDNQILGANQRKLNNKSEKNKANDQDSSREKSEGLLKGIFMGLKNLVGDPDSRDSN